MLIWMSFLLLQFVPFRDYIDRTGNHILSMARLAKDVLAEIPDQFLSYMRTRGIKPSPAPPPYTPPGHPLQTQIWNGPRSEPCSISVSISESLSEVKVSSDFSVPFSLHYGGCRWTPCFDRVLRTGLLPLKAFSAKMSLSLSLCLSMPG